MWFGIKCLININLSNIEELFNFKLNFNKNKIKFNYIVSIIAFNNI